MTNRGARSRVDATGCGRRGHLLVDPAVGLFHAVPEADRRRPSELFLDERVLAAAPAHAFWRAQVVTPLQFHAGDLFDDVDQLVDRDELVAADVNRFADLARQQRTGAVEAVVDVHEAAGLFPV